MSTRCYLSALALSLLVATVSGQVTVRGNVEIANGSSPVQNRSNVVVWILPGSSENVEALERKTFRLTQDDKRFLPHLLVVPLGSTVEFPNHDQFFHNVFSVYNGTRFDLGLYESGSSKLVQFNRPGPSYIFCNIHSEMSAVVLALPTNHYAVTNDRGEFTLDRVMPGEYEMKVWYERSKNEQLENLSRKVRVGDSDLSLTSIKIQQATSLDKKHKNKFGEDYDPPPSYKIP
jgi:plastocyanin